MGRRKPSFISKVLFWINLFLAIALLLAETAIYVSAGQSNVVFIFGMGYPLLLLVNGLFLIYWIIRRRKTFLLPLIVILAGYQQIASLVAVNILPADTGSKSTFELMSFNVRAMNRYNWIKKPGVEQKIVDFMIKRSPDILCVQEFVDRPFAHPNIKAMKKAGYRYVFHEARGAGNTGRAEMFGLVIFSKYKIKDKGIVYYDEHKRKARAIYADIVVNGETVRVYNIHLYSMGMGPNDYAFMKQFEKEENDIVIEKSKSILRKLVEAAEHRAVEVDSIAAHIRSSPHPVIVSGDFNEPSYTYAYPNLRGDLKDSFLEAGRGFGLTYRGVRRIPSLRIDYVLHSAGLTAERFTIIRRNLSDHYPILVKFAKPGRVEE